MKNSRKAHLIICILILYSVISVFLYVNSNRLEVSEDHKTDSISEINTSDELILIKSIKDPQKSEISIFIENLLKKSTEILQLISINCLFSSGIFIVIKFVCTNKENKEETQLDIKGVNVSEDEYMIFNLIEDFLNQKKIFDKEKVFFYVKSRANNHLNKNGINLAINNLLKKNLIIEGSRLTRRTVLLNINREKIFKIIGQYPGIYKHKISKMVNLSQYVTNWHLTKLIAFDFIRERNINGHKCYFNYSLGKENDTLYVTINKEKCRKIIEFLHETKHSCTKNQISKELNMHYNTIVRYIKEIENHNLLNRIKLNNREFFTLDKQEYQQISKRLH
ncbi:MAG: hypothetical protein ACFFA7_12200 [Promethearchaeota archaeon]